MARVEAEVGERPKGVFAGLVKWVDHRMPIFALMNKELNEYPTPRNLSYWWNFGSLAGIALVIMIATGIIADFREPCIIRMAPVPLYNSFEDVFRFGELMRGLLAKGEA